MAEQKEAAVSFRLIYPAFYGRGAALRAAATIGGVSYEDHFLSMAESEEEGKEQRRWTGIPEIIVYSKEGTALSVIGQSNACLRYIGTIGAADLYPSNPLVRALIDEILDGFEDMMGIVAPSVYERDESKKKQMRAVMMQKDKLPFWFNKFELRLGENEGRGNKKGFFVGDSMTIADLKAFYRLRFIGQLDHIDMDTLLAPNKRLTAFRSLMKENEGSKKSEALFIANKAKYEKSGKQQKFYKNPGKNVYGSL